MVCGERVIPALKRTRGVRERMRPARRASRLEGEWDWRVEGVEPCGSWSCASVGKCLKKIDQCKRWHRTYSTIDRRDTKGLVVGIERQRQNSKMTEQD